MAEAKSRKSKGSGSITRMGDGRYLVRLTRNGRQLSAACRSQKEAEKKLKQFRQDLALGKSVMIAQC